MGDIVIAPGRTEEFVELARTKSGRLFRKHVLSKGTLIHPTTGDKIPIDDAFLTSVKANFDAGVCDIVQVPLANDKNQHSEDPDRNVGEVIGVEVTGGKLYTVMDIRDEERAGKVGKTYLGASAMLHLDYPDTKTGKNAGPTLLHTAITNRPYVTGLESYEEIVAATSDRAEGAVLLLTEEAQATRTTEPKTPPAQRTAASEETAMGDTQVTETAPAKPTRDELLTALKDEHGIDVTALQAQAAEGTAAATLTNKLAEALAGAGVVKLAAEGETTATVSTEDVVGAVAELAERNVKLTGSVQALEKRDAEREVDTLIKDGRIIPAEREARVELKLSAPAMFDRLLPSEPIVKLNSETLVTPEEADKHKADIDAEVARLAALLPGNDKNVIAQK